MDFSKYKVIIIDDEVPFRKWLKTALSKYFKVQAFEAKNPIEGFELIEKIKPDLIILDLEMPIMDGYTALKEIRSNPETKDTSVIICTGLSSEQLLVNLIKLKITDYVIKSAGSKIIIDKIYKALINLENDSKYENINSKN